jgi:hypothetical protein
LRFRRTSPVVLGAALAALGAAACVSGFDRNDQIVNGLRILGVSAHIDNGDGIDWADAEAGDTVTFKALVANPSNIPGVTVTWVTCLPSPNNTVTPCTSEAVLRDPTQLPGMPGVLTLGSGDTIQYTVPSEASALTDALIMNAENPMTPNAQCALFIEAPIIVIAQGNGSTVTALKYLRLSPWSQIGPTDMSNPALQHYVRNANPTIEALNNVPSDATACVGQTLVASCDANNPCAGGATCSSDGWCPPASFPDGPQTICGQLRDTQTDATGADVDIQTYYYCGMDGVDGSEMEFPSITWYETAGTEASIANSNTAGTPDLAARTFQLFTRPPGPFTLYGVVRDGRDGENWIAQTFQ